MIGKTILHYKVEAKLGAGGMGQVFLALDERTQRKVALKFVGSAEDSDARERLTREAQAAARLSHPGLATLYALEEADGELFLVQEYIEGETLTSRFKQGAFSTQEAIRLAEELTAALDHAHKEGVLHRDLKPDNILVGQDGSYKIVDFGIARMEGVAAVTEASDLIGTLPYMAPERAKGDPGDARADLFSLGTILYESMTGKRAFPGGTQSEVLYQVINDDPIMPDTLPANAIPLAELIHRLMTKEPKTRPSSAEMVLGILQGMETSSTDHVPTIKTSPYAVPKSGRSRWLYAGVTAAALVVVAVVWWTVGKPSSAGSANSSVAVLYFENLADPDDSEKIGAITGNLLITSLARSGDLNVMSTQNILDALRQIGDEGTVVDKSVALEVAKKVNAGRIVTGTILQTEPYIIITAEVSDVRSGRVLSAERIEGQPGESVFQVVDALSATLVSQLAPAVEPSGMPAVAEASSGDLEAHRQYINGLEELAGGDLEAARRSFAAAVARDPEFAQAYYQLAIVRWWQEGAISVGEAKEAIDSARRYSSRLTPQEQEVVEGIAELLDADYSGARTRFNTLAADYPRDKLICYGQVEGNYHDGDFAGTIKPAERALGIDPNYTLVTIHYVDALQETGRQTEAMAAMKRFLKQSPRNVPLWGTLIGTQHDTGDGDGVIRSFEEAVNAGVPKKDMGGGVVGNLISRGRIDDAREWATLTEGPQWLRREWMYDFEYQLALRRGRFTEAVAISDKAWENMPPPQSGPDVGPGIPIANGFSAFVGTGDWPRVFALADTLADRVSRLFPQARRGMNTNFALMNYRLGYIDRLRKNVEAIKSIPPLSQRTTDAELARSSALLHSMEGDHEKALELIDGSKWVGLKASTSGFTRFIRMFLYRDAGMFDEQLALLDTLRASAGGSTDDVVRLHFWKAQVLENLGRLDEAAVSYGEFLEIWKNADPVQPEMEEARTALARIEASTS